MSAHTITINYISIKRRSSIAGLRDAWTSEGTLDTPWERMYHLYLYFKKQDIYNKTSHNKKCSWIVNSSFQGKKLLRTVKLLICQLSLSFSYLTKFANLACMWEFSVAGYKGL